MKIKKLIKITGIVILGVILLGVSAIFGVNGYVKGSVKRSIITAEQAAKLGDADCIIVLGCQVKSGGRLSLMLTDRMMTAIDLYNAGASDKLLLSGDHSQKYYNEVGAMKNYAVENGVPSEDVFMDHAGLSTYETVYRAKEIFGAKKVIIVTQEYHLYRALYIAKRLGLEAYGVACDRNAYSGQVYRDLREVFARDKDFVKCIFKPEPTFSGEKISLSGNGDSTNG